MRLTTPPGSVVLAPGAGCNGGGATVWTPPAASFGDARAVAAAVQSALARAWHTVAPASWLPDPVPVQAADAAPASPPRRRKHRSAPARVLHAAPRALPPPTTTLLTLADVGLPDPLSAGIAPFPGASALAAATVLTQLADAAAPRVSATFCVARTPTGAILLVDPHAAHERVRLEALTAAVLTGVEEGRGRDGSCNGALSRTALTPPVTLTSATPADVAALERYSSACTAWGWSWHAPPPPPRDGDPGYRRRARPAVRPARPRAVPRRLLGRRPHPGRRHGRPGVARVPGGGHVWGAAAARAGGGGG